MARYRLNNQTKKNLKLIEACFTAGGFDKKEAISLSRVYYGVLSDKTERLSGVRELDAEHDEFSSLLDRKQESIKDKAELAKFNKIELLKAYDKWVRTGDVEIHKMFASYGLMNEPEAVVDTTTLDDLD